jgi:primosomal protein N'
LDKTIVIGPFPAAAYKIKNVYRINIIIKTARQELPEVKKKILSLEILEMKEAVIDVDPLDVL